MSEKQKRRNAWDSKNNEIAALKAELSAMKEREAIAPFVNDFISSLGMLLAHTPFNKWPHEARIAFEHAERKAPTAAWLYKKRLPLT